MAAYFTGFRESVEADAPGTSPADHGQPILPFTQLGSRRLEQLVYALRKPSPGQGSATLMVGSGERGRDVVLYDPTGRLIKIIQVKNQASRLTLPELVREVLKLALHAALDPTIVGSGVGYEMVCVGDYTEPAARLIDQWPAGWPDLASGEFHRVSQAYASLAHLQWEDVRIWVCETFPPLLTPAKSTGLDLSLETRKNAPVLRYFFSTASVADVDDVARLLRSELDPIARDVKRLLAVLPPEQEGSTAPHEDNVDATEAQPLPPVPPTVHAPWLKLRSQEQPDAEATATLRKLAAVGTLPEQLWSAFALTDTLNWIAAPDEFEASIAQLLAFGERLRSPFLRLMADIRLSELANFQYLTADGQGVAAARAIAALGLSRAEVSGYALDEGRIKRLKQRSDALLDGLVGRAGQLNNAAVLLLALGTVARSSTRRYEFYHLVGHKDLARLERHRAWAAFTGWVQLAKQVNDVDSQFRALYDFSVACWSFGERELAKALAIDAEGLLGKLQMRPAAFVHADLEALREGTYPPEWEKAWIRTPPWRTRRDR